MTGSADAERVVDLDDLKRVLAEHRQRHARQKYPFCEDFGCMSIEPLVAELERLNGVIREYATNLAIADREAERLREREAALREIHDEQIRKLAASRDWWRRRWERQVDETERLRRLSAALRGMLAQGNPCIHQQIESAREDLAAGRTITFEELDAALAQAEQGQA